MPREFIPISLEPIEISRFWDKIMQLGPDDCWLWQRNRTDQGYGLVTSRARKTFLSHRVAYWLANGDFEWSQVIRHSCHTPGCCNPRHLIAGTHQDNSDDMVAAERGPKMPPMKGIKGEAHPASKFTDEQKRKAISMYFGGGKVRMKQQDIANSIGCGRQTVVRWCREYVRDGDSQ